jgi:hypothetical protein
MAITNGYNCITSRFGTGQLTCEPVEGLPTGFILVPKGWTRLKSLTFDDAYVQEQIQLGNFVPFNNAFQVTVATPEPTTQESQSGILSVVRQGKPTFTAIFKRNLSFQAAAYSYNSDNQYDALITYDTGFIKAVESVDGTYIKGVTVGMLNTNGYQENDGSNSAQTTMMFQITDPLEYNQYAYLLTDLDFNPNALRGIINTVMTITSADVSNDSIVFGVVWKGNEATSITGLAVEDVRVTMNGTEIDLTSMSYSSVTQKYTIVPDTTLVAGEAAIAILTSASPAVDVADVGGVFYAGTSNSFTITA